MALALVTACGGPRGEESKGEPVACALDGATEFADICKLERDGPRFSIHRPDGGFRRFEPVEGQGVRSIDGADAAVVEPLADGLTELSVDGDRYRVRVVAPAAAPTPDKAR